MVTKWCHNVTWKSGCFTTPDIRLIQRQIFCSELPDIFGNGGPCNYTINKNVEKLGPRYIESQFETEIIAESEQNGEREAQGCKYLFCKRLD